MPELPEVETVRRTLEPRLIGRRVAEVEVAHPGAVRGITPEAFAAALRGRAVAGLRRRGKYLIVELAAGQAGDLVIHLGMSGRLLVSAAATPRAPHTHLIMSLDDGGELRFVDPRRFGGARIMARTPAAGEGALARLGPEPLGPEFDLAYLRERLRARRARIKDVLLDQRLVAGIGNIYADEALHRAGIHPARRAHRLGREEAAALWEAVRTVIAEAIAARGTTLRDYVDGAGRPGGFAAALRVYGRAGKPCPACGTPVARIVQGGRGTHFCPACQPARGRPGRRRGAAV